MEFLVMAEWLKQQWNEPSRDNWYVMQNTAEIRCFRQAFGKNPKGVTVASLKLPFKFKKRGGDGGDDGDTFETMSPEKARQVEAVWFARLGLDASGKPRAKANEAAGLIKPKGTGVTPVRGEKKSQPPVAAATPKRVDPRKRSK